jgi:hypothetical protein
MAEAGGAFVTRSFKRMLNDAPGRKYSALQTALKAYLERKPELPPPPAAVHHEEAAAVADEMYGFLPSCLCFLQLGFSRCTWQIWWVCIPLF